MSGTAPAERARQRIAMYWAAGCGGCDMSLLEIGPHLLELVDVADVVFSAGNTLSTCAALIFMNL